VPFKANSKCRHHIPKQKRRLANWPAYEAGLRQRGDLTVWFSVPRDSAYPPMSGRSRHPEALARTRDIVARCRFSLTDLCYQYPDEIEDPALTPPQTLDKLVRESVPQRYPAGLPESVERQLQHELRLIAKLGYAPYFLAVNSIVRFARSKGILCQGRGGAANSAVCYVLGVTSIDPVRSGLLFEHFVSAERKEPPDIDVDFEHERREEVIQWLYERYGRDRAAICGTGTSCAGERGAGIRGVYAMARVPVLVQTVRT
jgi:DNA polymerase III alpha subunit